MSEQTQKRLTLIVSAIVVLVVVIGGLALVGIIELPGFEKRAAKVEDTRPTARDALSIALEEAVRWQPDAKLAFMNSGPVGETGRSSVWKTIFISERAKGKGYLVEVADLKVIAASEMPYSGIGADFPGDAITPEEAIRQVRAIPGYENVEILGVEAVYGPSGKVWYWGVKTSRGVVSVEANKK